MRLRALFLSAGLAASVLPAAAQEADFDPAARAKVAGEAARLGQGSGVFTGGTVDEVVVPFEGANPPEISIGSGNIDARTNEVIAGDSDASDAYRNVIDSVTLRPAYDLGTDHIGITVGDQATISAEDIAGQYFSSTVSTDPACNFTEFSVLEPFERFCDVHSNMREETCTISRIVEVDLRDTWRCARTTDDVTVSCAQGEDGTCAVEDLPEGNPASQCNFVAERCVAWENGAVRQPETGSRIEASTGWVNSGWIDDGGSHVALNWGGSELVWGEYAAVIPYTDAEGWTYEIDLSNSLWHGWGQLFGVYRYRSGTREPATGELLDMSSTGYSYWYNDGVFLIIGFQGTVVAFVGEEHVGWDASEYVAEDGCTYFRGTGEVSWGAGVYRICPGESRCSEIERDYSCTTNDQCTSLASQAACTRTQHSCLTAGEVGCALERSTFECHNDLNDHAPAARIDSRIERIEDRLVNSCDPSPEAQGCAAGESRCSVGAEVRTIMGFPVSRDCWAYEQSFTCLAEGVEDYTDCGPFQADPSCEVIGQTCLSFVESDETLGETPAECQHWEYQYRCGGGMNLPEHCSAFNVCVGDLCEGIVDEPNTDFGNAAAWLTVLDEAAKDSEKSIDMQNVTLFAGTGRSCKVGALGTINCCNDSGWANGILGDCSESELALMDRIQAKAAVYIGTYCSRKVLGICLQKRRSYCTFNSQLGMVFQKEIRRLSGRGWGSAKSPNCAGLPLDQIETINWDQIDLSEAFEDMIGEANVPTTEMVTDYLRDRLELTAGAISQGD